MADCRIIKVRKPNRYSPHEHITHVQIIDLIYPRSMIIGYIDDGSNTFYTYDDITHKRADVFVRRIKGLDPFIQTYADNDWGDNLLSLPPC